MNNPEIIQPIETIHMRARHPILTWLFAFILVGLGYYLSIINYLQVEWLTRSGCMVVLLGIWSSIGGIIEERILTSRLDIQHRIALSRAKLKLRKIKAPKDYIESEIASVEQKFEDKVDNMKDDIRLQLGILEVSLLMTGTFIWGFGDLFFKINL